jgi:ATP-dependent DNA ligase
VFAFDLLELGGKDLRRAPLEERKGALAKLSVLFENK